MEALIGLGIIVLTIIITILFCNGLNRSSVTIIQNDKCNCEDDDEVKERET